MLVTSYFNIAKIKSKNKNLINIVNTYNFDKLCFNKHSMYDIVKFAKKVIGSYNAEVRYLGYVLKTKEQFFICGFDIYGGKHGIYNTVEIKTGTNNALIGKIRYDLGKDLFYCFCKYNKSSHTLITEKYKNIIELGV